MPEWLTRARAARFASLAILLLSGITGLVNNEELAIARTPTEWLVALAVVDYGVMGILVGLGFWTRRRWARHGVVFWAAGVLTAATVGTVLDGGAPWWATALAGLATLAIVLPVVLHVRHALSPAVTDAAGTIADVP